MGCWNATCGLTQIPIRYGDDVRGFFVYVRGFDEDKEDLRRDWSDTTGFREIACPFLAPIYGQYNDYGSIEDIEEDFGAIAVRRHFRIRDLKNFVDKVERGAVSREADIQWSNRGPVGIGLFFVLDHFYQSMRELPMFERYAWDGQLYLEALDEADWSYQEKSDISFMSDEELEESNLQRSMTDLIMGDEKEDIMLPGSPASGLGARIELEENDNFDYDGLSSRGVLPTIDDLESGGRYNKFRKALRLSPGSDGFILEVRDRIKDLYVEGKRSDDPEVQELKDEVALALTFSAFMNKARKQWIPGAGKGSQDDSLWPHALLTNAKMEYLDEKVDEERWDDEDL